MNTAHPQTWSGTVYVQSIRSWNPKGFGGAIFAGCEVDERGELAPAQRPIVVIAGHKVLRHLDPIEVGQFWRVSGPATEQEITAEHYRIRETAVRAEELAMVRESGQMIIHLLARNRRFPGVGPVKARALWLRFGEDLYDVLDRGDLDPVREVLNDKTARRLLEGWRQHASGRFVAFLAHHGFPPKLGSKVVSFFGADAEERLREDPYRLLSFSGSWREVDSLARSVFTVSRDDPRRLRGAVEEALYRLLAEKHTAATAAMVRREVHKLLQADRLVVTALREARSSGAYLTSQGGRLYHAVGAYVMERRLAERACSLVRNRDPSPTLFLATLTDQGLGHPWCETETPPPPCSSRPSPIKDLGSSSTISKAQNANAWVGHSR
jgi:exodeoxyribonuclease V alpha subunit